MREVALRKLLHGKAFNIVDGLDDYDDDFITALPLGDNVTAEKRHQAEVKLQKEKAALLEESRHAGAAKECVNDELENDESVAVDTSDVDSGDGYESQHEAADPVAQIDNDDVAESTRCSPT